MPHRFWRLPLAGLALGAVFAPAALAQPQTYQGPVAPPAGQAPPPAHRTASAPRLDAAARGRWAEVLARGVTEVCLQVHDPYAVAKGLQAQAWPAMAAAPSPSGAMLVMPPVVGGQPQPVTGSVQVADSASDTVLSCTAEYAADDPAEALAALTQRLGPPKALRSQHGAAWLWTRRGPDGTTAEVVLSIDRFQTPPWIAVSAVVRRPRARR